MGNIISNCGRTNGQSSIEMESELIEELLTSAKYGPWETVWGILGEPKNPKHAHLLNVIPESRRWGVLHQAVFSGNVDTVKRLLKYRTCDIDIKAKQCISGNVQTDNETPFQIAIRLGRSDLATVLRNANLASMYHQRIPTFHTEADFDEYYSQSLILITLSSYKNAFHPAPIDPNKTLFEILKDIYTRIQIHWGAVQSFVADSVYTVSEDKARAISKCATRDEFFSQIVNSYTDEDNSIYLFLNMAFRRQRKHRYRPTGEDLAMGPYCVMYQILLLFWDDLEREHRRTYRKMKMNDDDVDKYKVGTKFIWLAVTSSALKRGHVHAFPTVGPSGDTEVIFEIDNSANSVWQPRNIEKHAVYEETERTYPAGGKFKVTSKSKIKDSSTYRICLKLLKS